MFGAQRLKLQQKLDTIEHSFQNQLKSSWIGIGQGQSNLAGEIKKQTL